MSSLHPKNKLLHLLHKKKPSLSPNQFIQTHSHLLPSYFSFLISLQLNLSTLSSLPQPTSNFHQIQQPSSLKWRLMMIRHASDPYPIKSLTFFQDLMNLGGPSCSIFDPFVYASLIKSCNRIGAVKEGKSVHCYVIKAGLDCNVYVLNSFIHFYLGSGKLNYARVLFDTSCERNVVTFNCMVSGYVKAGDFRVGLSLFVKLLSGGFGLSLKPNYVTLVILVSGCVQVGGFGVGNSLHSYCCKTGLDLNIEVCNVLIDYYAKCGCIHEAARVFIDMAEKDLVSWNTMITCYAKSSDSRKAFSLFRNMRNNNIDIDRVTLIGLITACANSRDYKAGNVIHGHTKVWGMDNTLAVGTALINMYSKCGVIQYARKLFEELPKQCIDPWNSMIHAYVECGLCTEALNLFPQVQCHKLKVDETTLLGLILACRNSGELNTGWHLHSYIEKSSHLRGSTRLCNSLIDMYAKCGDMNRAKSVFNAMSNRDVISWTTIVMGYAINGEVEKALVTFKHMDAEKIMPNSITFLGVLLACNHAGRTEAGINLYAKMQQVYQIKPTIEHYGCMVDMNARAGMLGNAYQFVKKLPIEPNAIIWRMLMNACKVHGHCDLGLSMVNALKILKTSIDPEDHVLFSNIFAETEKWDDVLRERSEMQVQEASKVAGKSSVSFLTE